MGFRSLLRERFPACTIAASLESGEDQARAGEVVHQALRSNPGVRGIYNVSAGNSAIAKVIRALGLTQKIVLITHGLTPERRAMLREGVLDAIIDQNPRLEAQRAFEVLQPTLQTKRDRDPARGIYAFNIFIRENCPPAGEATRSID